jgi:hypothetical protein
VEERDRLALKMSTAEMFVTELKQKEALTAARLRRIRIIGFSILGGLTAAALIAAAVTGASALDAERRYWQSTDVGPGSARGDPALDVRRRQLGGATDGLLGVAGACGLAALTFGLVYRR